MLQNELDAIKQIIEQAYIQGIHESQDRTLIDSGFHADFAMLVQQDDVMEKVTVDEWLDRIEVMKANNPEMWRAETTYTFDIVDAANYAAVAKLDVFKGEIHFSTDYMLLYRFESGWKIVSKVFAIPA